MNCEILSSIFKKRLVFIVLLLITCFLSSCMRLASEPPESVKYQDVEYKTGFYNDLIPVELSFEGDSFKISRFAFQKVKLDGHNWIHTYIGPQTERTVYCIYSDWEREKEYYSKAENFIYYHASGDVYTPRVVYELVDIDYDRFDELMVFAEQHSYDPFNANADKDQGKYKMPKSTDEEIRFYRESKDGLFVSSKASSFYIIDDKLVLLYYYDLAYGDKDKECMYGVAVPEHLSTYFIELTKQYQSDDNTHRLFRLQ